MRYAIRCGLFSALSGLMFFSFAAHSAEKPLDARVKELEKRLTEVEAKEIETFNRSIDEKGHVRTFFPDAISFGGYFESDLTGLTGPDTTPQISAHSNTMGLNITAQFNEHMRFVSQFLTGLTYSFQNPHNDATMTPSHRQFGGPFFGALVAQAYSEMLVNDTFNVQFGLGYVPYGSAFQQREPVLFRRRGGPQMIQATSTGSVGIAHPLWMGAHIHGARSLDGGTRVGYSVYTHSPTSDTKTLGVGGRVWSTLNEDTTFGISTQEGSMVGGTYGSLGFDFDRHAPWGGVTAEYAKNVRSDGMMVAESYYAEPYLNSANGKVITFVAADYLDNPFNSTAPAGTLDPIKKWIWGGGVNWIPISFARFRLCVFEHDYVGDTKLSMGQQRNYQSYEISSGIAF